MNEFEKLSEVLKALAHPARLQIVAGLLKNECNVSQIQQSLGSQHLRILKNENIIKARIEGTTRCYRVIDKNVKKIIKIIEKK